jgi:uncharacterized membrane protein
VTGTARATALAVLAIVGTAVSAYLAAYELGWIDTVWDPLFGTGSERVLTSGIARLLPVPDAVLGTAGYAADAILAALLAAGVGADVLVSSALALVAGVGAVVGIALAVSQPLLVGTFCTLCLVSTLISIVLAAGAVREAAEAGSWPDRARHEEVTR